jgi:hypothetical protein
MWVDQKLDVLKTIAALFASGDKSLTTISELAGVAKYKAQRYLSDRKDLGILREGLGLEKRPALKYYGDQPRHIVRFEMTKVPKGPTVEGSLKPLEKLVTSIEKIVASITISTKDDPEPHPLPPSVQQAVINYIKENLAAELNDKDYLAYVDAYFFYRFMNFIQNYGDFIAHCFKSSVEVVSKGWVSNLRSEEASLQQRTSADKEDEENLQKAIKAAEETPQKFSEAFEALNRAPPEMMNLLQLKEAIKELDKSRTHQTPLQSPLQQNKQPDEKRSCQYCGRLLPSYILSVHEDACKRLQKKLTI